MRIFLVPVFIFVLSFVAFGQPSAAQAAAERLARSLAAQITAGDTNAYRKFIDENFEEGFRQRAVGAHFGFFNSMHDQSRGLEVIEVQDWEANAATLLVKYKLTGLYDGLYVRVTAEAPFKIMGIGLRPARNAPSGRTGLGQKEIAGELAAFSKKLADADVFSGTVLIAKDGQVIYKAAFGMANKDFNVPNRVDTKFNLGSMNKMFTGVAIAQLVEKGKLSYDDPLSKFVPDFPNPEAAKKIRIKHLLTHTSGLGGYFSERYQKLARDRIRTVDDMMNLAREDEKDVRFEPGSRWAYSNTGMMVLGKVIEVASGQSYFDYIRENIYKPAGMVNTDCFELDKVNTNLAVGYDKRFTDNGIEWGNNIFAHVMRGGPHGGGYSTVEDLLRFDQALRSGKLVTPATLKLITSPKPELNSPGYGYGFSVDTERGTTGHSGGFPGISSNLDIYMDSGWTAIVMSNYSRGSSPISRKIEQLIQAAK